jgi:hypothetical protein
MSRACRPVFSAAISVVPDPPNGPSTSILAAPLTASLISGSFERTGCPRRSGAMRSKNEPGGRHVAFARALDDRRGFPGRTARDAGEIFRS